MTTYETVRGCVVPCLVHVWLVVVATGCTAGRNEPLPQLHMVKGTVRLDGNPLAAGTICLDGENDARLALIPATAKVVNGSYEVRAASGKKTVRIFAPIEAGEPDSTGARPTKETIAPAFNTNSTTVVEVLPHDDNVFDFDVKSK